ncbi:hypothetical protein PFISCL1PPCAC_17127, partial [Pristionchus fissidentatus]
RKTVHTFKTQHNTPVTEEQLLLIVPIELYVFYLAALACTMWFLSTFWDCYNQLRTQQECPSHPDDAPPMYCKA